jgi:hypothetical protein
MARQEAATLHAQEHATQLEAKLGEAERDAAERLSAAKSETRREAEEAAKETAAAIAAAKDNALEDAAAELEAHRDRTHRASTAQLSEVAKLGAKLAIMEEEVETTNATLLDVAAELEEAKEKLVTKQSELATATDAASEASARRTDAEEKFEEATLERDAMRTELRAVEGECAALRKALEIVQRPPPDSAEVDLLRSAVVASAMHAESVWSERDALDADERDGAAQSRVLESELARCRSELNVARTNEATSDAARCDVAREVSSIHDIVSDLQSKLDVQEEARTLLESFRRSACAALGLAPNDNESTAAHVAEHIHALRCRTATAREAHAGIDAMHASLSARFAEFRQAACTSLDIPMTSKAEEMVRHIATLRERAAVALEVDGAVVELRSMRTRNAMLQRQLDERDAAIARFVDLHDDAIATEARGVGGNDEAALLMTAMLLREAVACEEQLRRIETFEAAEAEEKVSSTTVGGAAASVLSPRRLLAAAAAAGEEGNRLASLSQSARNTSTTKEKKKSVPSASLRRRISSLKKELVDERAQFAVELALRDNAIEAFAAKSEELKAAWQTQMGDMKKTGGGETRGSGGGRGSLATSAAKGRAAASSRRRR